MDAAGSADLQEAIERAPYEGVFDPTGLHHEFSSGMHGQKLDLDKIPTDSPLYYNWISSISNFLYSEYDELPQAVVGVARGTNRVALSVAERLQHQTEIIGVESTKAPDGRVYLSAYASKLLFEAEPQSLVVVEDVATSGYNAGLVASAAQRLHIPRVSVLNTWQRRPQLERLAEAGIPYKSMIHEYLPTYSAEDCARTGFCAQGWRLIPYPRAVSA
ncbi:MAG: hypothetical protein JWN38_761 [Candidatus Saccharibacteria bacterium]|nr:hypothetical protein [Candidatus Saccharibacteria bacterium]